MEIVTVDVVKTVKPNEYAADLKSLAKAHKEFKGEPTQSPAGVWVIPVDADAKDGTAYHTTKIGQAARAEGFTASLVSNVRAKDGKTATVTYRLKDMTKSGPRNRSVASADESAEIAAE